MVNHFLSNGYIEVDTAYVYNNGNSEQFLGEIIQPHDTTTKIATKVNPRITGSPRSKRYNFTA